MGSPATLLTKVFWIVRRYMAKPYLLFDFDGTIANSIDKLFVLINGLAPRYGYQPISRELFEQLRNLPLRQAFKLLKLPLYKLGRAIPIVLHEYRKIVPDLEPCEGIVPMLRILEQEGIPMSLISSNNTEYVQAFLHNHEIACFDWVEGTGGILKKHTKINRQIKKHGLDKAQVVYVGDETRDIKAARKSKVRIISVAWGLHSAENLLNHKPDHLVRLPEEIVGIAKSMVQP